MERTEHVARNAVHARIAVHRRPHVIHVWRGERARESGCHAFRHVAKRGIAVIGARQAAGEGLLDGLAEGDYEILELAMVAVVVVGKAAITRIADKIPAAFSGKADRKRWISEVTNQRMKDLGRRTCKHA